MPHRYNSHKQLLLALLISKTAETDSWTEIFYQTIKKLGETDDDRLH